LLLLTPSWVVEFSFFLKCRVLGGFSRVLPECNALARESVKGGFRWVTSGFTRVLLLNQEESQAYPLFVEVKEFRDDFQPLEFIEKRFQKLGEKGEVVERKRLRVNGHEALCAMWISRKKMFFRRKEVVLAHLECMTYCNFTRRLLLFRVSSSHVENFMRDLREILSILCSATCHA